MFGEKIKQLTQKSKILKIILMAILIAIIIFYLKIFFTKGVYLNGTFLKKQSISDETHYIGKNKYGDIQVIVKGKGDAAEKTRAEVTFMLPKDINKYYTVNFNSGDEWSIGEVEIKDENENTLFEGRYGINNMFLFDKNGEPLIENGIVFYTDIGKERTYYEEYQLSFKKVVEFACLENETIRGESEFLMFAVFLILITIIDFKYPLFFFTLSYCLSVKDPEPSDLYKDMQGLSWIVFPIISVIMLIVAL